MIKYTKLSMSEQYDIIEKIAQNYAINFLNANQYDFALLDEFLNEENNAICIPTELIVKRDYNNILLTCIELAKELTLKTDCIFYVCIECPNDTYNECIVINSNYNFNEYC